MDKRLEKVKKQNLQRRVIRDKMRKSFFADLGIVPSTSPLGFVPEETQQLNSVLKLMDEAIAMEASGCIEALKTQMAGANIGISSLAPANNMRGRIALAMMRPDVLAKTHFSLGRIGCFDADDRD